LKNLALLSLLFLLACQSNQPALKQLDHPEKSWVFWYWMKGAVSKEGITADLEAMKEVGLGGAYLMPIQGVANPPLFEPTANQLTPEWWEMIRFAMQEAKRLDFELGMHASDGFALAGGPWITPELSMQKIVWSETFIEGDQIFSDTLLTPDHYKDYYKDLAVFAFPNKEIAQSTYTTIPKITASTGENIHFLVVKGNQEQFRSTEDCWFQYEFEEAFTCQSLQIITKGNNYQAHRLLVETSDDGVNYRPIYQLVPPRHGWQDTDAQVTYSIPNTTAKYFRFQWKKEGTEPGAEDLDAAKWSPRLKIAGLELSSIPKIHQFEGKTGEVWRISPRTTEDQLSSKSCFTHAEMINLTDQLDSNGRLNWKVPEGNWTILRIGHTSTGHTNYTGGGGLGLECDKFNPVAINAQFDGWFGEILKQMGPELTGDVLKIFHVDSWECGSQNWSPVFRDEFIKRRGYDPIAYLPIVAGFPINDADFSEKFLYDVRQTISELVTDNFYGIMAQRAHENQIQFSAESVAPTMLSDGLRHYASVDIPMGEFWLNSPTHDKPNDMLDAISGAHVYGKNIIQAEGFTELRTTWDEHPAMLKTLLDRNYALGINRLSFHVSTHNPWTDRTPGITLGTVGLYFQRNQTWWEQGSEFVKYTERCQRLLQEGDPVVNIAVFTGEGLPRRSLLPDRLVSSLPGLFGENVVLSEAERLKNIDQPQREKPIGVSHSANMADPENWLDPLNGYKYDSFNKDALLRLAQTKNGKIALSTGANYGLLVLPQPRKMDPNPEWMSKEILTKLNELVESGATLLIGKRPQAALGLNTSNEEISQLAETLWDGDFETKTDPQGKSYQQKMVGKGLVINTPFQASSFSDLGIEPDFIATENSGVKATDLAWTHRRNGSKNIYFISNQLDSARIINVSLRNSGQIPTLYNPVSDESRTLSKWQITKTRTNFPLHLEANEAVFIIFETKTEQAASDGKNWIEKETAQVISNPWTLKFDTLKGGPQNAINLPQLQNWIEFEDPKMKYYSGTAIYETNFIWESEGVNTWLSLGKVQNMARVFVNNKACGIAWTAPYQLDISDALIKGENTLRIEVVNTLRNRMIGDLLLPESERLTWMAEPRPLLDKTLLDAGLLGPVEILVQKK
jgi:hypothetical protein